MTTSKATLPLALAIVGGLSACADATTAAGDARVTVSAGTLDLRPPSGERTVTGTLPVTVANAGPQAVFVHPCSLSLERVTSGRWRLVHAPLCTSQAPPPIEVPAGTQRTFDFWLGPTLGAVAAAPPAGEYRINVMTLHTARGVLPEAARVSAPFVF